MDFFCQILLGSQALLPPTSPETLARALGRLGVPVFCGGMARGLLGPRHPLAVRQNRRDALRDADLIVLAGFYLLMERKNLYFIVKNKNTKNKEKVKYFIVKNQNKKKKNYS
jgi:thiamine pyrophosphate-dependent acetolactate synthase large subunit-like protein